MATFQKSFSAFSPPTHDRFGLPLRKTIMSESDQEAETRVSATEAFAIAAARAVMHQVGRTEARRLFKDALKKPATGKAADADERRMLLEAYDRALASGTKKRFAAKVAALEMAYSNEDPESIARQIRRLVNTREKGLIRAQALRRAAGRTIVGGWEED